MAKAKKMTLKEFKAVLEDSGMNFDCYGYEGILNMISGYVQHLAEDMEATSIGVCSASMRMREQSDNIFHTLEQRGYYDDIMKEGK